MESTDLALSVQGETWGRAQYVDKEGAIYISRGYRIYRSEDSGGAWQLDCFVPARSRTALLAQFRHSARLLRYYIAAFRVLSNGTRIAIARDGVYRSTPGALEMERVFRITRGSRPLNLGVDREDRVLFGEYGDNRQRHEILLYVSEDGGRSFEAGYVFKPGDVRHVHNIIYDPYLDKYWVLAGDFGNEPGIGLLERDFSSLGWLARGNQMARAVAAIVERDCLLFGTDSELQQNYIISMDKTTGKFRQLRSVEGTSLYASRFGPVRLISTCVEASRINRSRISTLYASIVDDYWYPLRSYRKDLLPFVLFQLGTIVLPYSDCAVPVGMFSGQAVTGLDNRVCVVSFECGSKRQAR
jgi:hypothetical protein